MQRMQDQQRKPTNGDELGLLHRIARRDRDALTEMYLAYHPRLFKFIFRLTSSYATADELINDIMLIVWQKADSFRGESRVSTWIFGIAYRVTMRRVTRKKLSLVSQPEVDALAGSDVPIETEDWVQQGISRLPEAQQITVMLVFYLGLSYEETATITDCPVNTVKTRMFHARRKLKDLLEAHAEPTNSIAGEPND